MTYSELAKLLFDNNIPVDVHLMSDSGWECDPTEMDGVYYNEGKNLIVFTQGQGKYDEYWNAEGWTPLKTGNGSYANGGGHPNR